MAETDEPLIQQCPACGELIDVSALEPLSTVVCPSCDAPSVIATHIDQFELLDILGRGGMGVVYRAQDTSLDREVALKLLRKCEGATEEQIAQLANEAAITAAINHPNVVKVFTTGMDRGRFYIAMELVDQGTLDQLISLQGRVAEAQVLEVGMQIAQGLRAAHQAGLIHRDVKPGNILFAGPHTAKIVDFGLAIFMEDEEKVRGEIWGTPYYVAPEKLDNKPEDFRSDIYSLGGTLFHALAGRPPFEAENASMVALKHLKSQAVSLQAFAPWVSGSTAFVINRTLNKDPEQRYQSYDELIQHLEYARTELQSAKPPVANRVVIHSETESRVMGWLSLLLILLLIAAGVAAYLFRDQLFRKGESFDSTPGPAPAVTTPGKAASMFPEACAKLAAGDAVGAADAFRQAAAQPNLPPVSAAWANLLEGLAESAAGHEVLASDAFRKLASRPPLSTAPDDAKLAAFFSDIAHRMSDRAPLPPNAASAQNRTNHEAIGRLLFGVKNWQLGRFDDAIVLLREFRQTKPAGRDAWIEQLKPVAARLIEEFSTFQVAADSLHAAKNPQQKKAAIEALKKVQGKLAPRALEEIAKAGP